MFNLGDEAIKSIEFQETPVKKILQGTEVIYEVSSDWHQTIDWIADNVTYNFYPVYDNSDISMEFAWKWGYNHFVLGENIPYKTVGGLSFRGFRFNASYATLTINLPNPTFVKSIKYSLYADAYSGEVEDFYVRAYDKNNVKVAENKYKAEAYKVVDHELEVNAEINKVEVYRSESRISYFSTIYLET